MANEQSMDWVETVLLSDTGRDRLEMACRELRGRLAMTREELTALRRKHEDATFIYETVRSTLDKQVTQLQAASTKQLNELREAKRDIVGLRTALDMQPLAPLLVNMMEARKKHPDGPDGLRSLMEEVGEVANAMRRETSERVREELLDVATVALRLYLGEQQSPGLKLAGWQCKACRVFNSEEKEPRAHCRSCGREKA